MDSNSKRNDRARTPSHNASLFVSKSSASKRFTPRGILLNDTVCGNANRSELPKMKTVVPANTSSIEIKCDIAYNDYLQALMKQEIIECEVEKQKLILDGQILLQSENLKRRESVFQGIRNEIELLKRKDNIIMMLNSVRDNLETLKTLYTAYQMDQQMEKFSKLLTIECDKVILKNVKPISNQEEYDKLFEVLQSLQSTLFKIVESGRDFDGIHNLAQDIRISIDHIEQIKETRTELSTLEKDALSGLLNNLSEIFSRQYIDQ